MMMITIAGIPVPPSSLATLTTMRTPAETKRLVRDLNEHARKQRDDAAAKDRQREKDLDEQIALTRRLSEGGRTRRAASAVAATRNVFDFYRDRETARQQTLAAMSGARR